MTPLEQQLGAAGQHPQYFGTEEVDRSRLSENLLMIEAELDAPAESRLARLLRRLGVDDLTVPLVTATPALRRSWFVAVAIAVLFALAVASNDDRVGVDRIAVFLALAPLVPLLGVALAFGKGVDPTHDLVLAAPRDTFSVFLIRALTVFAASSLILLFSSLLLPAGGAYRFAWLLPATGLSTVALAFSARFDPRRVATVAATSWIALVVVVTAATSSAAMFGPVIQVASLVVGVVAFVIARSQRGGFEDVALP